MNELQLSYSSIKDFEVLAPNEWKNKWIDKNFPKEIKTAFTFGSLLDCLLFEPNTFERRFIVSNNPLPSDSICDLVAAVVNHKEKVGHVMTPEQTLEQYSQFVLDQVAERNYWSSRKPETNLKNILKGGSDYFHLLNTTVGKLVVSQSDVDKCLRMRENAWKHPVARHYLIPDEGVELDFQKTLKTTYKVGDREVKIKCIFDACYTNHNERTQKVVDLKSTANASGFSKSVEKYRYGAQMGLYCYALFKSQGIKPYTIEPPSNIVVDKQSEQVFVFDYTWDNLKQERWGNDNVTGWHHLIGEIARRYDENDWK